MTNLLATWRWVRTVALLLLLAPGAGRAAAPADEPPVWNEVMVPGTYWVDPGGAAGLAEARAAFGRGEGLPYSPQQILPTGGGSAIWFHLAFPPVGAVTPAVLNVPHTGMNVVELYSPAGPDEWSMRRSGDLTPVAQWPMRDLTPAFELLLMPEEARPSLLRIQHSHPIGVRWGLWDSRSFDEYSKRWHLLLGGYGGFIVLVVLLSCFNAVTWRDPIHLYYAAYVVMLGLSQLSQTGVAAEFLWPHNAWWNDIASVVLPIWSVVLAGVFIGELIAERGQRWLMWAIWVLVATGVAISIGFLTVGRGPVFEISNLYYLVCFVFYVGAVAWFAWRRPRVGLWVLAGVLTIIVGATFAVLRNMGILPLSFATQYGAQVGVALEIPLILIGLYFRSRERRDSQVRLSALMRVDPLTGVGTHRVLMERLEHLLQRHRRDRALGAVLRVRIGNLQDIRQEYGVEVVQAAQVKAASIVARAASEGDTVARHRDGDFVLMLEGRMGRDQAAEAARNIIARGLAFSRNLPPKLALALHVACACAPLPEDAEAEVLLASLDFLLDDIQKNPGKALRFLGDGASVPGSRAH